MTTIESDTSRTETARSMDRTHTTPQPSAWEIPQPAKKSPNNKGLVGGLIIIAVIAVGGAVTGGVLAATSGSNGNNVVSTTPSTQAPSTSGPGSDPTSTATWLEGQVKSTFQQNINDMGGTVDNVTCTAEGSGPYYDCYAQATASNGQVIHVNAREIVNGSNWQPIGQISAPYSSGYASGSSYNSYIDSTNQ